MLKGFHDIDLISERLVEFLGIFLDVAGGDGLNSY